MGKLNLDKLRESRKLPRVSGRKNIGDLISESYSVLFECKDDRIHALLERHIEDVTENPTDLSRLTANLYTLRMLSEGKTTLKEDADLDDPRLKVSDTDIEVDTEMKEVEGLSNEEPEADEDLQTREEKTATVKDNSEALTENKIDSTQFNRFRENSKGKVFMRTLSKSLQLSESTKVFNLQESIDLYKASNSMLTQMAIELEHNQNFAGTFNVCTSKLSESVQSLLRSICESRPVPTTVLESLRKFSRALHEDDEMEDFVDWISSDDSIEGDPEEEIIDGECDDEECEEEETLSAEDVAEIVEEIVAQSDEGETKGSIVQDVIDQVSDGEVEEAPDLEEADLTPDEEESLRKYLTLLRDESIDSEETPAPPTEEELDALEEHLIRYRKTQKLGEAKGRRVVKESKIFTAPKTK